MKVDDLAIKDGDFAWQIMKEEGIGISLINPTIASTRQLRNLLSFFGGLGLH